jgi:mannose-1-phosphate guanylyltransferase
MFTPIILSGGVGARLWPVFRESHPKPFMKLPDGQSLNKTQSSSSMMEIDADTFSAIPDRAL